MTMADSEKASIADYLAECGARYWPRNVKAVRPYLEPVGPLHGSDRMIAIPLPDWATDLGVGSPSALWVEEGYARDGDGPAWERVDWAGAALSLLAGLWEREQEKSRGAPLHSYAFRLTDGGSLRFDRAWVNRIFLFLRRRAAKALDQDEDVYFGPKPSAEIVLTHDVDAIRKTVAVRIKQGAFNVVNTVRLGMAGHPHRASEAFGKALRFGLRGGNYDCIGTMLDLEERAGVRSTFHVYGGRTTSGFQPRTWLMDPSYHPDDVILAPHFDRMKTGEWRIGLHPSFDSWNDPALLRKEKSRLEHASDAVITACRQHWLRFSWSDTWSAQIAAGIQSDSTLGFNDRSGFRVSAALAFRPYDIQTHSALAIKERPLVFMDSHFYDYGLMNDEKRYAAMAVWIDETRFVGGEVAVLWHQRVLHPDYGWRCGFEQLLELIR